MPTFLLSPFFRIAVASCALQVGAPSLLAQHQPADATVSLESARALRDASQAAWQKQDFRTASDKLQAAIVVYHKLDGDFTAPCNLCARAIVWNEFEAGDTNAALEWFETLAEWAHLHGDPNHELSTALGAITQAADRASQGQNQGQDQDAGQESSESQPTALQLYTTALKSLTQHKHKPLMAQCLHNRAGVFGSNGDFQAMEKDFDRAIGIRKGLNDVSGEAWSLNNMAYHFLAGQRTREALAPLTQLMQIHGSGQALDSQWSAAFNLNTLLDAHRAQDRPSKKAIAFWWDVARDSTRQSDDRVVFRPERALWSALMLDIRRSEKTAKQAIRKAQSILKNARLSAAIHADVTLRIAEQVLAHGDTRNAEAPLLKLQWPEDDPCAAHLQARRDALLAALAARRDDIGAFDEHAALAIEGMEATGHRSGLFAVYEMVTAQDVAGSKKLAGIRDDWGKLQRSGSPGGQGGSARSQGTGNLPADAGAHFPAFELRWNAETQRIDVKDLVGGESIPLGVRYRPHFVTFNGLGLELLGGYAVVRSVNYGAGSGASGGRSTASLDDMGNYVPITAEHAWQVTLNGSLIRVATAR